jgi:hypothetical protein
MAEEITFGVTTEIRDALEVAADTMSDMIEMNEGSAGFHGSREEEAAYQFYMEELESARNIVAALVSLVDKATS